MHACSGQGERDLCHCQRGQVLHKLHATRALLWTKAHALVSAMQTSRMCLSTPRSALSFLEGPGERVPVWHVQEVLRKAGQLGALGSLEENAPDEDEEFEGEEGKGEEDGEAGGAHADDGADDLAAAMAQKVHIR